MVHPFYGDAFCFCARITTVSCYSLDSFCHDTVFIFGCAYRASTQRSKEKFGNFCWVAMTLKALLNSATNCDSSEGFSAITIFCLTMQFFSCLKSISFYCSISFCITKERQVPIFVKKKLWQMVLCSMAHCFILRNFSIALCSSLIIKVYLHIICYGIRNITVCIFL